MSGKKKSTQVIKFETKLYKAELRKTEKESFRQLLGQEAELSDDNVASTAEIHAYKEQARVAAARLVEKGANLAGKTEAHQR